jgi:hypothetical protein
MLRALFVAVLTFEAMTLTPQILPVDNQPKRPVL